MIRKGGQAPRQLFLQELSFPRRKPEVHYEDWADILVGEYGKTRRTIMSKRFLLILVVTASLVAIGYMRYAEREKYRNKIISLTSELSECQTNKEEVRQLLREPRFRGLILVEDSPNEWDIETPTEFGATNWVLYLTMSDSSVIGLRVRTSDSQAIHPKGAPPDRSSLTLCETS
jgi:hypothetical protein